MADSIEYTPETKPHISILPEVNSDVIVAIGDNNTHPVAEHWSHLANQQPALLRKLLAKANTASNIKLDPRQAFLMGAAYTHEALHEQAIRDTAKGLEDFQTARDLTEPEETPVPEASISPLRAIRLGAALIVLSWRQRIRGDIERL